MSQGPVAYYVYMLPNKYYTKNNFTSKLLVIYEITLPITTSKLSGNYCLKT